MVEPGLPRAFWLQNLGSIATSETQNCYQKWRSKKNKDRLFTYLCTHTNSSSGRIHNLKIIMLFATGEEKGREGRIFTVYLLWILNHGKELPILRMDVLN